jgi:nucleotide-binding universal stress UspA family protein
MGWTEVFEKYLADRGEVAVNHVGKLGADLEVKVLPVVLKGSPAEEILDYSEKNEIDLIVMGTQGLTGVKRFLLGSVAENVLRHSKVPVMILR